jgi:predicted nucleotidyltransferase
MTNMNNTLPTDQRAKIISALRAEGIVYALLFGSGAEGQLQFDSDVDLAVAGDCALSTQTKCRLIANLAAITNRPIDLIDLKTARGLVFAKALLGEQILCDSMKAKGEAQYRRVSLIEEDLNFAKHTFGLAQPAMFR